MMYAALLGPGAVSGDESLERYAADGALDEQGTACIERAGVDLFCTVTLSFCLLVLPPAVLANTSPHPARSESDVSPCEQRATHAQVLASPIHS
jgi:hypothetical protein